MSTSSRPMRGAFIFFIVLVVISGVIAAAPSRETGGQSAAAEVGSAPEIPERIAAAGRGLIQIIDVLGLFPGAVDSLVALGVTDQGMGDFYQVIDGNHRLRQRLGRSPGPEEIAATSPDYVLLRSYLADGLGEPLEALGIPVLYLDLETPADFAMDIRRVGALLQQGERAEELVSWFDRRVEIIESSVPRPAENSPRALILQVSGSPDEPRLAVAPGNWIQNTQLQLAGAQPVGEEAAGSDGWAEVTFEQIAAWNPEYIFLVSYRSSAEAYREALETEPLWGQLQAVENQRLYAAPADFYSWIQADTRWILGAEWFARILHPGALQNAGFGSDMEQSARMFFADLYDLDERAFDEHIRPRISGDLFGR